MSRPRSDLEALREDLRKVYDGDPWRSSYPAITVRYSE